MNHYQAVVFDLDGTLLNTLEDLADSVNHALTRNGLPRRSVDEVRRFVGNGIARLMALAVPEGTGKALEEQCLSDFQAHYLGNMEHKTAPYPGVLPLLEDLRRRGVGVAVVSNKFDGAVKGLCPKYFGSLVSVAMGECDGVPKKPDPEMVYLALEALGVSPAQAVYVGDSDVDIETARRAGMPCISVNWGFRDRDFLTAHGAVQIAETTDALAVLL